MNTRPAFRTPCPLWAEKLAATHPDDLSPSERRELQAHLATCPSCAAIRAEYEVMGAVISQLPAVDPGPGMPPGLLHAFRTQGNHTAWTPPIPENVTPLPLSPALPARAVPNEHKQLIHTLTQTLAAVLIIAALLGSFLAVFTSHHMHTTQSGNTGTWHIIPSANPGAGNNSLFDVAALSANDAWAVGLTSHAYTPVPVKSVQTLIEHWNGTRWSVVPSPNSRAAYNILNRVIARSPNDVWAIGLSFADSWNTSNQLLIEHWNGSQWSIVQIPPIIERPNMQANILNEIAFISLNNIWAVGTSLDTYGHHSMTLVEHWNGSQWSIVASPNPGLSRNELHGVVSISANNIWAAGLSADGNSDTLAQTLVEHWDGSRWSVVTTPTIGTNDNYLNAISTTSANDIWTVGASSNDQFSATGQPLIEHWNGSQWHVVKSPTAQTSDSLDRVIALSANDAWVLGAAFKTADPKGNMGQMLTLHWNGTQLQVIPAPRTGAGTDIEVAGIAPIPGSNSIWALGSYNYRNSQVSTFTALYY